MENLYYRCTKDLFEKYGKKSFTKGDVYHLFAIDDENNEKIFWFLDDNLRKHGCRESKWFKHFERYL